MHKNTEEDFPYGDIGVKLGQNIDKILRTSGLVVEKAIETIRATVVGAGSHTTDVSGSTIRFDASVLPIKNIPVIRLSAQEEKMAGQERVDAIKKRVDWFKGQSSGELVALSLMGSKSLGFDDMQVLAEDIVKGMEGIRKNRLPLIVLLDNDLAQGAWT